jgi:drug/metabolite transporter (DMT)-like permease
MKSEPGLKAEPGGFSALWVLAALLGASIEPILVKLGYRAQVTPWQLLLLKNLVAAVVILPLTRTFRWVGLRAVLRLGSVSSLLMLTNLLSLLALTRLPAVTQMTVVATTPALVALVGQVRGTALLGRKFWLGFGLCFAGVLLTIDAFRPGAQSFDALGLLFAFGAVLSSTVYRTALEAVTAEFKPKLVSSYVFLINAALALILIAPWVGSIPRIALPLGAWIGVAAATANVAFVMALHLVGAVRMSVFTLLQRPLVILAAALLLGEPLGWLQFLGIAAVLWGIRLAQPERRVAKEASA